MNSFKSFMFLLLLWARLYLTQADRVPWFDSEVSLVASELDGIGPWNSSVSVFSNRRIYRGDGGHFKLSIRGQSFEYGLFEGETDCIEIGSGGTEVLRIIRSALLTYDSGNTTLNQLIDTVVKRYGNGKIESNFTTHYLFRFSGRTLQSLAVNVSSEGCAPLETVGLWSDAKNWEGGAVPTSRDDVYFPPHSGIVVLNSDEEVNSIEMDGGLLIAHETGCPHGWSVSPDGSKLGKCYKLMEDALPYLESDAVCRGLGDGFGSLGTSLVQIEDHNELDVVKSICRGQSGSSAFTEGCWIGLQDAFGTGYYNWRDPASMLDLSFRDWRRGSDRADRNALDEPGAFIDNGDNCVHIVPWQEDPLILEQGSFEEVSCFEESKAYVCQMLVTPRRYSLRLRNKSYLNGGGLRGGHLVVKNSFDVSEFFVEETAHITVSGESSTIKHLVLCDGSELDLHTNINITEETFIGETSLHGLQPIVFIASGYAINTSTKCSFCDRSYNVTINAKLNTEDSTIYVDDGVDLILQQGGLISSAKVDVQSLARLILDGYAMRLATYDAFELSLSHRGDVVGEYLNSVQQEEIYDDDSPEDPILRGVYRIGVYYSSSTVSDGDISACIPYHASASEVRSILDSLPLVQELGGVTVRRYGEADDRFHYGYDYRIELDAPNGEHFLSEAGVTMELYCVGIIDCGCAQTKVSYFDPSGQTACDLHGNSSMIDTAACALPPTIVMSRMSALDYTETTGEGELILSSGSHRLPADSPLIIGSVGTGKGTVGADVITWNGVVAQGSGTLIFTGKGWEGWDSSILIFSPFNTKGRGASELNNAPGFTMSAVFYRISDIGSVLTAGPGSNLTWDQGTWDGGIIGGRSTLYITRNLTASGTGKSLRYACTLHILEAAVFDWQTGNVSLHNGAQVIVDGTFWVNVFNIRQYFGFAELLSMPADAPYQKLLESEPPFNEVFYFDDQVADYLRDGSYINPLCGEKCMSPAIITVQNNGTIVASENCNATFVAPINLEGSSRLQLGEEGYLNAQSGGSCGNLVFMEVGRDAVLELSGGRFFMGATCTMTGEGELLGTAGTHDLSFSINAHITIAGGTMRWPASRGDASTLRFYGGLLISSKGMLLVEPWETTIIVDKVVHFKDDCILQFPMIGTAAQASVYDSLDAPDLSPRGNLTATNIMQWDGGTLRGKADFVAKSVLYLGGGEKRIRSLAKLVNLGHAEWAEGNIIMADQADFVNLGTVQMANGTALFSGDNLVEGTVIPVENGGDFFALDFHSWDLDQGKLDFSEYVRLRTEFVSRAPIGWTEELDGRV